MRGTADAERVGGVASALVDLHVKVVPPGKPLAVSRNWLTLLHGGVAPPTSARPHLSGHKITESEKPWFTPCEQILSRLCLIPALRPGVLLRCCTRGDVLGDRGPSGA